jgi:hypothetical protein
MTEGKPLMTAHRLWSSLLRETSGLALTEFAIAFPILLALGMYGIDTANFALTHLRLNQLALNLADNASRVGASSTLSTQQMREIDVEDVFQAAKIHGKSLKLETNGRVILSSLEKDKDGNQRIHWQRCFGAKTGATYESHHGKAKNDDGKDNTATNIGTTATAGMGDAGSKVNAPTNSSGVMFVEVNYRYTPLFGWLSAPADLRYVGSFIVRDPRDFSQIYTSAGVTPSYCGYASRESPT